MLKILILISQQIVLKNYCVKFVCGDLRKVKNHSPHQLRQLKLVLLLSFVNNSRDPSRVFIVVQQKRNKPNRVKSRSSVTQKKGKKQIWHVKALNRSINTEIWILNFDFYGSDESTSLNGKTCLKGFKIWYLRNPRTFWKNFRDFYVKLFTCKKMMKIKICFPCMIQFVMHERRCDSTRLDERSLIIWEASDSKIPSFALSDCDDLKFDWKLIFYTKSLFKKNTKNCQAAQFQEQASMTHRNLSKTRIGKLWNCVGVL